MFKSTNNKYDVTVIFDDENVRNIIEIYFQTIHIWQTKQKKCVDLHNVKFYSLDECFNIDETYWWCKIYVKLNVYYFYFWIIDFNAVAIVIIFCVRQILFIFCRRVFWCIGIYHNVIEFFACVSLDDDIWKRIKIDNDIWRWIDA